MFHAQPKSYKLILLSAWSFCAFSTMLLFQWLAALQNEGLTETEGLSQLGFAREKVVHQSVTRSEAPFTIYFEPEFHGVQVAHPSALWSMTLTQSLPSQASLLLAQPFSLSPCAGHFPMYVPSGSG